MDFEIPQAYYIPDNNSKESDKRNYFSKVSEKTKRDMYFCQDSSDDYSYSYGDTTWK